MLTDPQARFAATAGREREPDSLVFAILPSLAAGVPWQPFFPGVEIHWLYQHKPDGPSAALIRFQPGASVPMHEHRGYEHIYILSGSQSDGGDTLMAGSLMVHPPGTRHQIFSHEGCVVLALYEKPAQFVAEGGGAPT